VWKCGEGQAHRRRWPIYISPQLHLTRNVIIVNEDWWLYHHLYTFRTAYTSTLCIIYIMSTLNKLLKLKIKLKYFFVIHFWLTVCKMVRPILSVRCLSVCPVCDVAVLWQNGRMDQHETWHRGRPRPRPDCVRWGPSSPWPNGAQPPIFGPCLLWPNGLMDQDAIW